MPPWSTNTDPHGPIASFYHEGQALTMVLKPP